MKLIDAVWEKRNLGVATAEIELNSDDSISDFLSVRNEIEQEYDYICIKCAPGMSDFLFELCNVGYRFIETQIGLKFETRNKFIQPTSAALHEMYADRISFSEVSDAGFPSVLKKISNPSMFTTDRVYLDPLFPKDAAGKRYAYWCQDMKDKGSSFIEYLFDGKAVGFYEYHKVNARSWHTSIGGMYHETNDYAFLTPAINCSLLKHFESQGMKVMRSAVSTNNPVILRFHLSVGYQISDISYVYIKHVDRTESGIV